MYSLTLILWNKFNETFQQILKKPKIPSLKLLKPSTYIFVRKSPSWTMQIQDQAER